MLAGKTYSPEAIARILLKRAWLIVVLGIVGTAAAVAVGNLLPNKYRSETLIMLVPQRIPDSYVKTTVTQRIEDRLATLNNQILSRSRLERIIVDLNLYEEDRRTLPMEEVVRRMGEDIKPRVEGKESFRLSYVSKDPKTAQATAERLASLFIEENLRDRETVAEDTNQFLDSQLEDAKRRLIEDEKKLEEYRSRYSGELPTQVAANLQVIQNSQVQLQVINETIDRARERRLNFERQLSDLQMPDMQPPPAPAPVAPAGPQVDTTTQQLDAARARLQALLARYKPDHPAIPAEQRTIRDLEARLASEGRSMNKAPVEKAAATTLSDRQHEQRMRDLRAQIDDIDRQIADKEEEERNLRGVIANHQAKLAAVPKHESDLVELTRDYTTLQTSYQTLLAKREESKIAANLERRNIGEQFKVLDPARIPELPYSPKRHLLDLGGAMAGLALGVFLTGLLEYLDSSLKSADDVTRLLEVPVLALVPLMVSPLEIQKRRRRAIAGGVAVFLMLLGTGAAILHWHVLPQ